MYGFVEPWLTHTFNLQHTPYGIGDGNIEAHIINQEDFERTFIYFRRYSENVERATNQILERPQIINSNVVGLKIMLMRYWANEDILFSLTDGPIKENQQFRYFMNMAHPRFELEILLDALHEISVHGFIRTQNLNPAYQQMQTGVGAVLGAATASIDGLDVDALRTVEPQPLHVTLDNIEDLENRVTLEATAAAATAAESVAEIQIPKKEVVTEEMKIKMDGEAFINHLVEMSKTKFRLITSKSKDGYLVLHEYDTLSKKVTALHEFADSVKKNIVFGKYNAFVTEIKSRFNTRDIMKHTYIINVTPQACTDKQFVQPSITTHVSCLGTMICRPWVVYGSNVNSEIDSARKNRSEATVESILTNHSNSPYFKYDAIFKDTYTGIVWAVKDRCTIHCLADTTANIEFFALTLREISKRIDSKIPYSELLKIDKEYFDSMNNSNTDQYVEFAISNSKQIYNTLVETLNSQKNNFNQFMAKAMECAKLAQRYEDQLAAFDMKSFENRERSKALKTYQDTLALNKVKCITIEDSSINVYTKNIYVKDPRSNKWHDIGTFQIILGMLGENYDTNNTVRVYNTKYSGMGMNGDFQAPHIYNDGHICHGNMASGMVAAYKERNLFDLIYQIIIFLQSVNVSDPAGCYINSWPEVTEEYIKIDEEEAELVYETVSEEEKKFDEAICDAIPIHIN